ncbi:MAG: hypothetical protein JW846_02900 [Dehalococcoidia bacterium]|nr:hypothetical protein [Dehalococcoidia bacterium]
MNRIELHLSSEACIETTARRRYRELTQSALRGEKLDDGTMKEIELLRRFLESADFPRLRADSESSLRKGKHVTFHVYETDGEVACSFEVV